ncbi:hypothetical protein QAD02_011617 [Eretmocerus hayati]|uniref:Uncharacterized protein n=1 Tax=Eretmocerus hayati TaxID=131215 RepID=A0ACC2NXF6_9HYME|nr:hypothetical protein QAD02_011617 [Eretmocerus hayati]
MGKILRERCCNPFRVPGHLDASGGKLLAVQPVVRDRLPHVPFEGKVCVDCRNRIHELLRKRKLVKPSLRRGGSPQKRLDELLEQLPSPGRRGRHVYSPEKPAQQHREEQLHVFNNDPVTPPQVSSASSSASSTHSFSGLSDDETISHTVPVKTVEIVLEEQQIHQIQAEEKHQQVVPENKPATKERSKPNQGNSRSHHSTMSRRNKLPLIPADADPNKQFCCFCGTSEDNEVKFGKFYHQDGISTHYYCLLLSSNMEQKGNDDEGILGFLAEDIQKEIRRGRRLICSHCRRNGATLGCCNAKCKKIFHFPCGLDNGSLHQFFGEFRSYCTAHRPKQKIDDRVKKEIQKMEKILCYICYESVQPMDNNNTLWAPCCKKNAWFHRSCVQQLAMSAGYFFKCPLCNNKREFQTAMLEYGIYIPRQDASWELVPNAFEELLYRHDRCDAKPCQCPKGRAHASSNGKWELALCRMCGSQGTHVYCGKLKWTNPQWECPDCLVILNKPSGSATQPAESTSNLSSTNTNVMRRDNPTVNVIIREYDEDSDSDISVGNETVPFENSLSGIASNLPAVKLRPGPKSFKLQQVQKLKSMDSSTEDANQDEDGSSDPAVTNETNEVNVPSKDSIPKLSAIPKAVTSDVVCLDSDDDTPEILCESRMPSASRNIHQLQKNTSINRMGLPQHQSSHPIQSSIQSYPNTASSITAQRSSEMPTLIPAPNIAEKSGNSPVNIVISNVTSVDPEFFESVPGSQDSSDGSPEIIETDPSAIPTTAYQMKRVHPDEDTDCLIMSEGPKRARYEDQAFNAQTVVDSGFRISRVESTNMTTSSTLLPAVKQSPSKAMATSTTMLAGPSGVSTAHYSNLHGNAATATANDGSNQSNGSGPSAALAHARNSSELPISAVDGGPVVHSTTNCDNRGSKSKRPAINRTGLIPKYARLSDLKFKIRGDDFELSYGAYKIQINMNRTSDATKSSEPGSISFPSLTSFLELNNQNSANSKSESTASELQSNGFGESSKRRGSSRVKSLRGCVSEDDNTLLEYQNTMRNSQNVRSTRKSIVHDKRLDRADLKENWDPEVSSSTNNSFDTLNNNSATNNSDSKEGLDLTRVNSNKDDGSLDKSCKDNPNQSQRLLRRSSRHTRHFQSVQESNVMQNGDSADSSDNNVISSALKRISQTVAGDQSTRSSRSQKYVDTSSGLPEVDEHLKNVEMNDSKIMLVNKVNGIRKDEKIVAEVDFKVRIDLQKISKLLNAKPDLFFSSKSNGVRKLRVHRVNEKLTVESESGERKFLVKSRSFDCLLNLTDDEDSTAKSKSKSLANLSRLDDDTLHWADGRDVLGRRVRRSTRHKTRLFENTESFR